MARIFVDFNRLDSLENDVFDVCRNVREEKGNFKTTIDKLDWEVKSQERILRRSQTAVDKLDKIAESLNSYSRFVLTCYEKYDELEHLKVNSNYIKIESVAEKEKRKKQEQQDYIDDFENKNPDIKKKFDKFLNSGRYNDLTDEEKSEIKYRAYSADEPYRTIFLRNLDDLKIRTTDTNVTGNEDEKGTAFYKPFAHDISFRRADNANDSYDGNSDDRYDYETIFHESGHSIDDQANVSRWMGNDTGNYKAYSKSSGCTMTIYEAVMYDVYDNKNNPYSLINFYNQYEGENLGSYDEFKNTVMMGKMSPDVNRDYSMFLYENFGYGDNMSSVSDIYGGATRNCGAGLFMHPDTYWETEEKQKRNIPAEVWAEYFEGGFIQDETYIENMREYLPTACEIMDSYADDLAKKARTINI